MSSTPPKPIITYFGLLCRSLDWKYPAQVSSCLLPAIELTVFDALPYLPGCVNRPFILVCGRLCWSTLLNGASMAVGAFLQMKCGFQPLFTDTSSHPRLLTTLVPLGNSTTRPLRVPSRSPSTPSKCTISSRRRSPRASDSHCRKALRRIATGALASTFTLSGGTLVSPLWLPGTLLAVANSLLASSDKAAASSLNSVAVRASASTILLLNDCI